MIELSCTNVLRWKARLFMEQYYAAFHECPKPSFILKLHILYIFCVLEISASFRQGENGRYVYKDDLGFERYCHYCPPGAMNDNDNILKYQEPKCIHKNFPFQEKCDEEEQKRQLRPICNFGTLPSCPLLKMPKDGHWNCTSSSFYNETSGGYYIPVYTVCQLMCQPGFRPTEGDSTYCRETRVWDRDPYTFTCHRSMPSNKAGHHKISRRQRKKLSQILTLEEKLVKLKMSMLDELGKYHILNILLK
ncbi:hypothetical protein CHS0354_026088 [Potamilus streckersoni]|uniref:Sushi domain-containing protein n=1 Tax=Potamilus streckersoni TaxID=2493646 RepID=A0AAE0SI78_9BIVA|nr:hypothetical protein CHS0354_026088 [Potamilus streckersoni]